MFKGEVEIDVLSVVVAIYGDRVITLNIISISILYVLRSFSL